MATPIASSPTSRGATAGQFVDDPVEQVPGPVAVKSGDRDRVAETESVKLERLVVPQRVVDLVREHEDRLSRATEDLGHLLVAGRDAVLRVDDEEDEIGFLHSATSLIHDRRV